MRRKRNRSGPKLFGAVGVCTVLALAFAALPAMAQAQPTLKAGGAALPVGSHVVGTSSNLVTTTSVVVLTCRKVTLTGEVTANAPAALAGEGEAEGCVPANPLGEFPTPITSIEFEDEFFAEGAGEAYIRYTYDIPAGGLTGCFLEGPMAMTWTNGSNVVGVSGNLTGGGGSAGCPTSGSITGSLALETDEAETREPPVSVTVNE